jgi:hypothetical protein
MARILAIGAAALLASGAAGAETVDQTGRSIQIDHADKSKPNICWNYRERSGLPRGSVHLGGECIGVGGARTMAWRDYYDLGNGAAVRFDDSPDLTIRRLRSEYAWDTIKPANNSNDWAVEDSWLRYGRDDTIEADHATSHNGIVRQTFMESVHTYLSVTPGDKNGLTRDVRVEFHDNLMSLGCGLPPGQVCENRAKRLKYSWARPRGSGQAFKTRGGPRITLVFRNNVVMQGAELLGYTWTAAGRVQGGTWHPVGFNQSKGTFQLFQDLNVQASGNTFYWLGEIPAKCNGGTAQGLEFTTFLGACVPAALRLQPGHWARASNSRAEYVAEMERWYQTVWLGEEPPPDEEPEGTDPEPDPEPTGETLVAVDIRPRQCPNRVRVDRSNNLPVAIAGTVDLDVREIDPATVRLAGVPADPSRTRFIEDVSPYEPLVGKQGTRDCTRAGSDGMEDLLLRFSAKQLGEALGAVAGGATVVVPLTGQLFDGTPFRGEDVMVVLK